MPEAEEETTEQSETEGGEQTSQESSSEETQAEKDWQSEFKAQQRINRDLERKMKLRTRELETQLEAAKKPPADEAAKPDLDTLREQIRAESRTETLRDRALDKIEAKAARTFKDPEDALLRLGKNVDEYIVDGKIDLDAITDALEDLLKKRPDFGVTQGESKRFLGEGDGGNRGKPGGGKTQLTEADVKRLSKEGKHEEIEAARVDGRLNELLGIT